MEEDLLWGWTENKEQLCKLYGATLWEMPFPFPTGKCAGCCFQRGTELRDPITAPGMARWAELAWPVVPRPWLAARCCCLLWWTREEGSFLGPCVLICLLLLPLARTHHTTNILNVNADRVTLLLRTLPQFTVLPETLPFYYHLPISFIGDALCSSQI